MQWKGRGTYLEDTREKKISFTLKFINLNEFFFDVFADHNFIIFVVLSYFFSYTFSDVFNIYIEMLFLFMFCS